MILILLPDCISLLSIEVSNVSYLVELITLPFTLFSPTSIQPLVSLAVLPLCIRIHSKYGTSNSNGKSLLNLDDLFTITW
mgnify:FL=1